MSTCLGNRLAIKAYDNLANGFIAMLNVKIDLVCKVRQCSRFHNYWHCASTLWVILGPLVASVDCAKNRNVTDKTRRKEITNRCKEAIVSGISGQLGCLGAYVEEQRGVSMKRNVLVSSDRAFFRPSRFVLRWCGRGKIAQHQKQSATTLRRTTRW
jgi:hypothetical protein